MVGTERSIENVILCDSEDLGDEFHYLLKCPFLNETRRKYIKPYYYKRANILKFNELLNLRSEHYLRKLSIFLARIIIIFK